LSILSRLSAPLQKATAKFARWEFIKRMSPAAKHVGRLVNWDGGLAAVLFSLGWGFLQGKNFPVARILFTASCVFLALKAVSETRKFDGAISRTIGSVLAVSASLLLWIICWFWVFNNEIPEPRPDFLTWLWSYMPWITWLTSLPFRRILIGGLIVSVASVIVLAFTRERKERCPDKRLHALAEKDKAGISRLVRFPGIIYQPYFDKAYIDFGFSVFNNSLFDVVIENSVSGEIHYGEDNEAFDYPPKFFSKEPIVCQSRDGAYFVIRQPVRAEEIPRFPDVGNVLVWFHDLEIHFRGTEPFPEIGRTRINTAHYLGTQKRIWRDWNNLDFIFGYTEEQWALLSSGESQALATLAADTPREIEKANLVFKGIGRLHAYSLHGYPLEEGHSPDPNSNSAYQVIALTVRVENEFTNAFKPIPVRDVTAQVFYRPKKADPFQLNRGAWLGSANRVSFDVNDVHDLVIATVMGEGDGRFVYAIHKEYQNDQGFDKVGVVLSEDVYDIRVRVISEKEGLLHFEKQLVLEVSEVPKFRVSLRPVEEVDPSENDASNHVTDSE